MGWVTERHKCTLDVAFRQLRDAVKRDVEEANNLLPERRRQMWGFHMEEDRSSQGTRFLVRGFPISRLDSSDEYKFWFEMEKARIVVERTCPDTLPNVADFAVIQRWNGPSASCLLYIGNQQVSVDRISQLALEPMFFSAA